MPTPIALYLFILTLTFGSPGPLKAAGLAAEAEPVRPETSHVEQIKQRGFLWVRCFPQQISPFLAVNTQHGAMPSSQSGPDRFKGVDIDILRLLAEELAVELHIHPGSEATITSSFEALEQGMGDVVAGGLTITESRKKRFAFSVPYFPFQDVVLGPMDAKRRNTPLAGARLAVFPGSSFDENVRATGIPEHQVTYFDFVGEANESVALGNQDFTFADSTMLNPDELLGVRVAFKIEGEKGYGYVLPKGSDLKPIIDRLVTKLRKSGRLETILQKHQARGSVNIDGLQSISWTAFLPAKGSESP